MSLETIYDAVLNGKMKEAKVVTQAAVDAGVAAGDILHKACIPAMTEVGRQFEIGERFVPEMLIAARTMSGALEILRPLLIEEEVETVGKVVIGTVVGDLHDIGKNLVAMMLEGAGFEIIDLGNDVSPEKFVAAIEEHKPDVVCMSTLLTTTMASISKTMDALYRAEIRDEVKVVIGGAPVTQEFADKVKADGFAADAGSAPRVVKALLGISG